MELTLLDRLNGAPVVEGDGWPRPSILERPVAPHPSRGGELTLDQLLVSAWEGITADRTASCPLCSGSMEPRYGSGPGPVAARCGDCGTELE